MGLSDASSILWRQRQLLELLLYKLEVEQSLLRGGRARWLARATNEVGIVLDELRATELSRAIAMDEVAELLGLIPGSTLREIADAAPAPWASIFAEHRVAFLALTDEIGVMADVNRDLASDGHRAITEALVSVQFERPDAFAGMRGSGGGRPGPVLVDEVL
ncbi:MAG: flagellar export chaperone FlgN [Actinomycetota bacterium]|nr:flagellar export chaperone FlgN [Actinomycetota bacterium]